MSDNQNIDTTTNINETDTNKTSTDHSDDYEKICYVCRRPESKAGGDDHDAGWDEFLP